ncbi:MAG: protein translocase, partial [Clostridium sp.]
SIYEVKEILDGKVLLRDCIADKEVYTDDINLLKDFEVGSCMIARMVEVDGISILIDITISISASVKDVIVNDIMHLFKQYEDLYKDIKTFLIQHTHILYKYMQQLLEPSVAEYLKSQKEIKDKKVEQIVQDDCKVSNVIRQNAEQEDIDACISFWNEYKNQHGDVKGSEN